MSAKISQATVAMLKQTFDRAQENFCSFYELCSPTTHISHVNATAVGPP